MVLKLKMEGEDGTSFLFLEESSWTFFVLTTDNGNPFSGELDFDPSLQLSDNNRLKRINASLAGRTLEGFLASRIKVDNGMNALRLALGGLNKQLAAVGFCSDLYSAMVCCGTLKELITSWTDIQPSLLLRDVDLRASGDFVQEAADAETRSGAKKAYNESSPGQGKEKKSSRPGKTCKPGKEATGAGGGSDGSDNEKRKKQEKVPMDKIGEDNEKQPKGGKGKGGGGGKWGGKVSH